MSANGRISLGVAFLNKNTSAGTSCKCIIHAEFLLQTKQYLLTKITYAHDSNLPLGLKSSETVCENIVAVLELLSKKVAAKLAKGYVFDVAAMEILSEEDESWDDFKLGTVIDSELDEPLSMQTVEYSQRIRRAKQAREQVANRKINPHLVGRVKRIAPRSVAQKARAR